MSNGFGNHQNVEANVISMHFMGTSVELHAAGELPTGKESRVSIGYEDQIKRAMG
jgi:hypothetical protein